MALPIVPDREKVLDPDSVGVVIKADGRGEIEMVLFRSGWADVAIAIFDRDRRPIVDAPDIRTAEAFGAALDQAVAKLRRWLD